MEKACINFYSISSHKFVFCTCELTQYAEPYDCSHLVLMKTALNKCGKLPQVINIDQAVKTKQVFKKIAIVGYQAKCKVNNR